MHSEATPRRTVLAAAGAASAALALAACGGSDEEPDGRSSRTAGKEQPDEGGVLVETSEVPEGGGKILQEEKVVVTQPSPQEFKAFSAVCTHQGCLVSSVTDGVIDCACHGSRFAIADGRVTAGPATKALPEVAVTVRDGTLRRA